MIFFKLGILSLALCQAKEMEVNGGLELLNLEQAAGATAPLLENKSQDLNLAGAPQISDIGQISEALPAAPKVSTSSWGLVRPGQSVPF